MKISVDLKNCYGIKALRHDFDFSTGNAFLLYAPNGAMKTSLAKVFKDISQSKESRDALFPQRETECNVIDETAACLNPLHIFVVDSYDDSYESDRIATLLVDEELRKEYESIYKSIEGSRLTLLSAIGNVSNTKRNAEQLMLSAFKNESTDSSLLLAKLQDDVNSSVSEFADILYSEVINDKTEPFLKSPGMHSLLCNYIDKYNEIIGSSNYFRKGGFNHYNAATVSKNLNDNKYFSAKHTILLSDTSEGKREITSRKDFDDIVSEETARILNNPELSEKFKAIDIKIMRNIELRRFHQYLLGNMKILPELADVDAFKKKLWISYLVSQKELYENFLEVFREGKQKIESIVNTAKNQETRWREVVDIFKRRFTVPFEIEVSNQEEVILKDTRPTIIFRYMDGDDCREIGRDELLNVLCTGEQRALYMLNIIFEIRAREKENYQTILVLDDIADSFDYKNKFAIIEYLKEISETDKFLILLLTHNFDFFRTTQSRLPVNWENCYMSIKSDSEVKLIPADCLNNPFDYWKHRLHMDNKCLIAAIPMVRNIIQYTKGQTSQEYSTLTSLLHYKSNTDSITINELASVFNSIFSPAPTIPSDDTTVTSLIFRQADECYLDDVETINLENKVVFSIAIRLKAEQAMIQKINDPAVTEAITRNQTRELFNLFVSRFPSDKDSEKLLSRVIMMTPEAIHLNSFMYEPLIDLSDNHLKVLYRDVSQFANLAIKAKNQGVG